MQKSQGFFYTRTHTPIDFCLENYNRQVKYDIGIMYVCLITSLGTIQLMRESFFYTWLNNNLITVADVKINQFHCQTKKCTLHLSFCHCIRSHEKMLENCFKQKAIFVETPLPQKQKISALVSQMGQITDYGHQKRK